MLRVMKTNHVAFCGATPLRRLSGRDALQWFVTPVDRQRGCQSRTGQVAARPTARAAVPQRPTREDVARISRGDRAQRRGTGSRAVAHRLNAEERRAFEVAAGKGYVSLRGSGHRRERKGSPLANTFRLWCDSCARPAVFLHRAADGKDRVVVDLATLRGGRGRAWDADTAVRTLLEAAARAGVVPAENEDDGNVVVDGMAYLTDPEVEAVWQHGATWQLPPVTVTFQCESREVAKATAAAVADVWPWSTTTSS